MITGETNLMGVAELSNVEKLRRLFEAFNEKRDILHLLDHSLQGRAACRSSSATSPAIRSSMTAAWSPPPTPIGDAVVGVLGVIGPTRMAYERVIPIVDMTAKLLGCRLEFAPLSPTRGDDRSRGAEPSSAAASGAVL